MGAPTHVAHLAILGTDPFCLFTGASGGIFPPVAGAKSECAPHFRALLGNRFFRREGGDDFFETRIAAQRIPPRQQFQLTVAEGNRWMERDGQLFAGEIFVPAHAAIIAKYLIMTDPLIASFATGKSSTARRPSRKASSFARERLDQTQRASGRTVVWLCLDNFLLLHARSCKRHLGLLLVVCDPSDNAFQEQTRKVNNLVLYRAFA